MKYLGYVVAIVLIFGIASCGEPEPTTVVVVPSSTPVAPTATATATATPIPSTPTPTATITPVPPTPTPTPSPTRVPPSPAEIARSSVRVDIYVEAEGKSVLQGNGSGTIVSAGGQILTNAHVVAGADELVICLTTEVDRPPIPSYYAELLEVDYVLDLALIQISSDLDGNKIEPGDLDLPALEMGDSDAVDLGQRVRIFGYPGIGSETVTFTEGTVGGFITEDLGEGFERVWIKTDTDISFGNSGGTAVDEKGLFVAVPSAGVGSELETLGYMRPANLGNRYLLQGSCAPRVCDAAIYEPNDRPVEAYGPLESKTPYSAYLHENDIDLYTFEIQYLEPIEINLTGIAEGADYDLELYLESDEEYWLMESSQEENSPSERILYSPPVTGTYYVLVWPYKGYSLETPYLLQADYDGDVAGLGNVTVRGRLLDANTDRPIEGAVFFLLVPGVTGEQFIDSDGDEELVVASSITDEMGVFVLEQVPRGKIYTGFIATESDLIWEDDWLGIELDDPDEIDLGDLRVYPG